jgi:methionine-rich copper-binding protein CopC
MRRIAGLYAWLLFPLLACAHAHLQQAEPADGSVLTAAPTRFVLRFSEAAVLTALSVQSSGATQPQKIAPLPTAASVEISIPAPALAPGVYELRYRVLSADSHMMAGSVHFTIAKP